MVFSFIWLISKVSNNPLFVIASEAKQSQTVYRIASSLALLAMTAELLNNLLIWKPYPLYPLPLDKGKGNWL